MEIVGLINRAFVLCHPQKYYGGATLKKVGVKWPGLFVSDEEQCAAPRHLDRAEGRYSRPGKAARGFVGTASQYMMREAHIRPPTAQLAS